jgi:hypothetical protein
MPLITQVLDPNEKVYRLTELNLVKPPHYQNRRYQVMLVNRDDCLAEWWYDLGPAFAFTANQFTFPLMWEHTVAEAQAMAEEKRHDTYWQKFLAEKQAESTLVQDWINQRQEQSKIIRNQSVFGPGGHKQRNGFSMKTALEPLKERTRR